MKLKTLSALIFVTSTTLAASSVMAWESEDGTHSTSGSVALSSEYVWRGISQSDDDPAISGSFDYAHETGLYAGVWASNVDYDDDASMEVDAYLGYASEIGETGIGYDVGFLRYMFPGEDYNFNEVYGSLSYSIFTLGIAHSGDALGSGKSGTYYNFDAAYDLPMDLTLAAGVGHYDADKATFAAGEDSYSHYYIGLSTELAGFGLDLTYSDTDSNAEDINEAIYGDDDRAGDRFIFSVSRSF